MYQINSEEKKENSTSFFLYSFKLIDFSLFTLLEIDITLIFLSIGHSLIFLLLNPTQHKQKS